MQCIICSGSMAYYFSKAIAYCALGNVDYWRCRTCGFVASATHFEMPQDAWEQLNTRFHGDPVANGPDNPDNRPPPYAEQADMLYLMHRHALLSGQPWLDWGAGTGTLSEVLAQRHGLALLNFDRFIRPSVNAIDEAEVQDARYNLVVSSALFEHVRDRGTLDDIEACVARGHGALAVHTLVSGEIPRDPGWMYLLPVHCAFHTNRSMQILMDQWGYRCSVYNERAKLWVMFRTPDDGIRGRVHRMNASAPEMRLHLKAGFVDYWP